MTDNNSPESPQGKPKERILYVKGMHCASCEIIIEKRLLKKPQVTAVDASLGDASVKVYVEKGDYVDLDALNKEFADLGYEFGKTPFPAEKKSPREKFVTFAKAAAVAVGFLLVFMFIEKLQLGQYVSVGSSSSLGAFFLLGLVAGASSCAALIGGLLLSLIKHWNEAALREDATPGARKTPHVLFHAGRLSSYFVLGGALGALGGSFDVGGTTFYATLTVVVSIVMAVLALQMLEVSWATKVKFRLPKAITRMAANEHGEGGRFAPFITGAATFFLPCGFTLIAQGIALTSFSFWKGGLIMLAFALGTMPMLLAVSITGLTFTKKPHLTAKFLRVAGLLVLFFAIYNINGQMNVLGLPSLSDVSFKRRQAAIVPPCDPNVQTCVNAEGVQEVDVIARGFEYLPDGPVEFQAGVPTTLRMVNDGSLGCASFVASRGLIDGFVALQPGMNEIDLGAPAPGTYKLTCSMGMVEPLLLTFN